MFIFQIMAPIDTRACEVGEGAGNATRQRTSHTLFQPDHRDGKQVSAVLHVAL